MIYVITHKKFDDEKINNSLYKVLHVGKNDNSKPDYLRDDSGENISDKNPTFCELTGLYWLWKNGKESPDEITGLVHYRRFFTDEAGFADYRKTGKCPEVLGDFGDIDDNTVILPKRYKTFSTLYGSYNRCHNISDMERLKAVMEKLCPEYISTFDGIMNGHVGYYYNMFIFNRRNLERYCEWLFPILFELEKSKESDKVKEAVQNSEEELIGSDTVSENAAYQDRLYGFLSERLLQVWVIHNGLTIKEYPVFNTEERPVSFAKRNVIRIKYLWARFVTHKETKYIHKD